VLDQSFVIVEELVFLERLAMESLVVPLFVTTEEFVLQSQQELATVPKDILDQLVPTLPVPHLVKTMVTVWGLTFAAARVPDSLE